VSSLWPPVTAAGITLLLFGILGGPLIAAAGLAVLAAGLWGWIGELRAEAAGGAESEVGPAGEPEPDDG
jgi:hypothetical protein